jgi:hypothetical protein
VVLFPNPVTGDLVHLLITGLRSPTNVTLDVFTVAGRRVLEVKIPNVQPGQVLTLPLKDLKGKSLANGLYFVTVSFDGTRQTIKLLILN